LKITDSFVGFESSRFVTTEWKSSRRISFASPIGVQQRSQAQKAPTREREGRIVTIEWLHYDADATVA